MISYWLVAKCMAVILLLSVVGYALPAPDASNAPFSLSAGDVGLWRLDRGPRALDESESQLDGVVKGGEWCVDGRFGGCMSFSEKNAYVEFPDPRISLPRGRVECWLYPKRIERGVPQLVWVIASNAGWRYRFLVRPDLRLEFALVDYQGDSRSVVSRKAIGQEKWTHVAVEWDTKSSQVGILVDGKPDSSGKLSLLDYVQGFSLGASPVEGGSGLSAFVGRIDEVKLSKCAKHAFGG